MIWSAWFIIHIILYRFGIKWLKRKQFGQHIYEDAPSKHQEKAGTPTLGGAFIALSFFSGAIILGNWTPSTIWVASITAIFFLIGVIDDVISLTRKNNKGLSARLKFTLQIICSVFAVIVLNYGIRPISIMEGALYVFLLTGTSNATNLTDGVDALLSSSMIVSLMGIVYFTHNLGLYNEQQLGLLLMACLVMFLIFNWNPAKIFMGDAGSLMLGAFLASVCIISGQWFVLVGLGGVYILETLSVIIQVAVYKLRGIRVFLMTPIHHHFELLGLHEVAVVGLFVTIQLICIGVQILL